MTPPVTGTARELRLGALLPQPPASTPASPTDRVHVYGAGNQSVVAAKLWGRPPSHLFIATKDSLYGYLLPRPERPTAAAPQMVESIDGPVDIAVFSPSGRFLLTALYAFARRRLCGLFECTSVGLMPEIPPLFAGSVLPLAISDGGDAIAAKGECGELRLFRRACGDWLEGSGLLPASETPTSASFSHDASRLIVQCEAETAYLFRRHDDNEPWSLVQRFDACWDAALLTLPWRVVLRTRSSPTSYILCVAGPLDDSNDKADEDLKHSWLQLPLSRAIGAEPVVVSGDGVAYARVFHLTEAKGSRTMDLLKICFARGDDGPALFDVSDVWASSTEPMRLEWPTWQRPLLAYRKGSPDVRLIELLD